MKPIDAILVQVGLCQAHVNALQSATFGIFDELLSKEQAKNARHNFLLELKQNQLDAIQSLNGLIRQADLIRQQFEVEQGISSMMKGWQIDT